MRATLGYEVYGLLTWDAVIGSIGDGMDRLMIRLMEAAWNWNRARGDDGRIDCGDWWRMEVREEDVGRWTRSIGARLEYGRWRRVEVEEDGLMTLGRGDELDWYVVAGRTDDMDRRVVRGTYACGMGDDWRANGRIGGCGTG